MAVVPFRYSRSWCCAGVLLVLLSAVVVLTAQENASPSNAQLPARVRLAATADVDTFAESLGNARIPAGIVSRANDSGRDIAGIASSGSVSLQLVLRAFEQAHPNYTAQVERGLLRLRPKAPTVCESTLSAPVRSGRMTGTLSELVDSLVLQAKPALAQGIRGGAVGNEPPTRTAHTIVVPADATLSEALDGLARRLRIAWRVQESIDDQRGAQCSLKLFEKGRQLMLSYDLR